LIGVDVRPNGNWWDSIPNLANLESEIQDMWLESVKAFEDEGLEISWKKSRCLVVMSVKNVMPGQSLKDCQDLVNWCLPRM
jgi:hypothetical protein